MALETEIPLAQKINTMDIATGLASQLRLKQGKSLQWHFFVSMVSKAHLGSSNQPGSDY